MSTKKYTYHEPPFFRHDFQEREWLEGWQVYGEDRYTPDCYLDERWWYTDYPGYYISDHGRFYNAKTGRFLKPKRLDKHGHVGYGVRVDWKSKPIYPYQHRMLADAFIRNDDDFPIVRHINDNPSDNDIDNLMWGTMYDNHMDSIINGNHRPFTDEHRRMSIEVTRRPIIATRISTQEQWYFPSINDCVRYFEECDIVLQQANILKVLRGKRPHTCGYFFEYITREEEAEILASGD